MKYLVKDLYQQYGKDLNLDLVQGNEGLNRHIKKPEVHRPGLGLAGYIKNLASARILVFGKIEVKYIKELDPDVRLERLDTLLSEKTPAVIVTRRLFPPKELTIICKKKGIPLFRTSITTMNLLSQLLLFLNEEFSPTITVHGNLVEVYGVGVLIQGDSSIGKSEAALGLLEKGHRLISDDIVKIKKKQGKYLIGSGPKLTRHLMEIRGMGILNVAHLYGAVCVRPDKSVDIIIKLEEWDNHHFYDRVGLSEKYSDILGIDIPYHTLPVKPGRDVILLIETISLQHRLREMGYNSAREFNTKLLETIATKQKKKVYSEDYSKS
jgi:HPr kinase/phosphorylase